MLDTELESGSKNDRDGSRSELALAERDDTSGLYCMLLIVLPGCGKRPPGSSGTGRHGSTRSAPLSVSKGRTRVDFVSKGEIGSQYLARRLNLRVVPNLLSRARVRAADSVDAAKFR